METYALHELNGYIRQVLALNFPDPLWVRCEISRVGLSRGHAYLDLVEKEEGETGEVLAQASAVAWRGTLARLRRSYGQQVDGLLQDGMDVRLQVRVDFHERYGLKLVVEDIDPSYSLGRLEARRRQILEQVQREGLLDRNRRLPLPPVIQRVAVLSAEHAAGWHDFRAHLRDNAARYAFALDLYPTALQGDQVETEMGRQMERIAAKAADYDCIALIRGGGARLDLAAFDSLALARQVAGLPIPFFTGIGHEIDLTVLDRVAHQALKTPTAVAHYLIDHNAAFEAEIDGLSRVMALAAQSFLHKTGADLAHLSAPLPSLCRHALQRERAELERYRDLIRELDPLTILRRGFTLSLQEGRVLRSAQDADPGLPLTTRFQDGEVESEIIP